MASIIQVAPFSESKSASLQVLHNEDLIVQIFDALLGGFPLVIGKTTRSSLLHAALTCKNFLEPALDVLWRYLDSILPLLYILSTFFRNASGLVFVGGCISESAILRFKYYSVRVRVLRGLSGSVRIAPSSISYLTTIVGGGSLMPSLREIHTSLHQEASPELLFNLVSPQLTVLMIYNIVGLHLLGLTAQYLQLLGGKQPCLKILTFSGNISAEVLDQLQSFRSLCLLDLAYEVHPPQVISFGRIGSFQSLTALRLSPCDAGMVYTSGSFSLPNITKLCIRASPAASLALMRHLQVPNLISFQLELLRARKQDANTVEELFQRVTSLSSNFHVFAFFYRPNQVEGGLRSLPRGWAQSMPVVLTQLLLMDTHICLKDADVQQLCESGVFKSLELLSTSPFTPACSPTLACLVHFSKHCTRLVHLSFGLPVLFEQFGPLSKSTESYIPSMTHITKTLVLGSAGDPPPLVEQEALANVFFASMRRLFPAHLQLALEVDGKHQSIMFRRVPLSTDHQQVPQTLSKDIFLSIFKRQPSTT